MNNERRKKIQKIIDQLGDLKLEIEDVQNEEQTAFDNMPEGLQQAESGQKIEENASELGDAADEIDNLVNSLEEIIS